MCRCSKKVKLRFKKLDDSAVIPEFKTTGSAGMDISTIESYTLKPLERRIFKTGLAVAVDQGYEVQVRPRSGLACKQGITVINTPGTVDSDYRGEVGVCLINMSNEDVTIKQGERIAQLVINKIEQPEIFVVEELDNTERGLGGFGSSGRF